MAKCKRILCAILSVAMILSIVPMGTIGASAADVAFDTAAVVDAGDGKIVVPNVTLTSTKVIRVAADASGSAITNGTTIVPATPSGLPQINSGYTAQFYCDESPVSPQVVFTTDTELAANPSISCENNTGITFSDVVKSGNTYTWTITGGTGVTPETELKFVVDYSVSYTDSLTNKTVERFYKAYTTSRVENIAQPATFYVYRTRDGSVGHEDVRCSWVVRILGENTYGSYYQYNDENPDNGWARGYFSFITNEYTNLGSTNSAIGYATTIYDKSAANSDGNHPLNTQLDFNRPVSTTYIDRSLGKSLTVPNLRITQFERLGNRKDGYTYYARYSRMKIFEGEATFDDSTISSNSARLELGISQDLVSDVQLANNAYTNVPLTGSTYDNAAVLNETTGNYESIYTLVYSAGSHYSEVDRVANADVALHIKLVTYDKSELRGQVTETLEDCDVTTKLAANSEIGLYPQSWFYSEGWDNYKSALQNAQAVLSNPNTTQNDINAALSTFDTAVSSLKVAEANYELVDIAVAAAKELNSLNYTEESWARVTAALDAAAAAEGYSVFYQPAVDRLAMDIDAAVAQLEETTANWDLVDEAVAVYEQLDPTKYTSESWANLRNAVNKAQEEREKDPPYKVSDQAYVDSLAKDISDAIDLLEDALADYTEYDKLVQKYNDEVLPEKARIEQELADAGINIEDYGFTNIYTNQSWRRLQTALSLERDLTWQYQIDVDDAVESLQRAIDGLVLETANYDEVTYWIEEADTYDPAWYTPDSYAALEDAVDAVVEGKDITEQATVNSYAADIEQAIKGLKEADADYTAAYEAEDRMNNVDASLYTDESYQKVIDAYDAINWNLMAKDQDKLDSAVAALNTAIDELEYLPADYDAVEDAKARWTAITDTSKYTNASIAEVVNAINSVDYTKDITQQEEVDAMAKAINDAIDNLQLKGADYADLKTALSAAKTELDKHNSFKAANGVGYYTDATIAELEAAINAVPVDENGAVLEDKNIDQQPDVDALTTALVNAKKNLVVNDADYSELEAILKTVPSDEDLEKLYTVDSASALMVAVINANAVDPDLKIDEQATIDALVAEVDAAIKGLKFKDADYTTVENAITAARAKLAEGIWTEDSVKAVEDAINAVEYGKDINDQEAVYAMADAINNAATNLTVEYANYDKVNEAKEEAANINTAIVTPESYAKVTDAVNAVVEGLYAKDQEIVDGYAQAITDAIAALDYVYADWTKVDEIYTELANLDPTQYTNYTEVFWGKVYNYYNTDVADAKKVYVYVDTQDQVDAMYNQLVAYKNELIPVQTEPEEVARFEVIGGASVKTQGGVNYIVGLQTSLTKAKFQSTYAEYENVTLTYEMTTSRYLGTGSKITVTSKLTGEVMGEYVIVIYGDVDGSATINGRDALAVANSVSGASDSLTGAAKLAANVEGSRTTINAKDVVVLDAVASGTMVVDQTTGKGVDA